MADWKEYKIKDAPFEIIDGDRGANYPSQNEFYSNGHCLFLSTKNVKKTGFDFYYFNLRSYNWYDINMIYTFSEY